MGHLDPLDEYHLRTLGLKYVNRTYFELSGASAFLQANKCPVFRAGQICPMSPDFNTTRLLSGICFYVLGFWAPIISPLSPTRILFFPAVPQQPRQSPQAQSQAFHLPTLTADSPFLGVLLCLAERGDGILESPNFQTWSITRPNHFYCSPLEKPRYMPH